MSLAIKADDWKVCDLGTGGVGLVLAAGIWAFTFYSKKADISARFHFAGTGWGLGGETGSGGDVDDLSSIDCSGWMGLSQPFSVVDLDQCPGHIATAGIGAGVGIDALYISAGPKVGFKNPFFSVQSVGGLGYGVGISALSVKGAWLFKHVSRHRP